MKFLGTVLAALVLGLSSAYAQTVVGPVENGGLSHADLSGANITATGGTTARTLAGRAADVLNVMDFGAKCDGTTDDSSAVNAAVSAGKPFSVPAGATCNAPSVAFTAIAGMSRGPGNIKTSDGNPRGPLLTELTTQPTTGNWSSDGTAWTGGLGGTWAHEHIVTGAATLGQPTSTYVQIPEASGEILGVYNTSGWNNSTSSNTGRTGLAGKYLKIYQYGQGDLTAESCYGIAGSTLAGATSYLASPAIECLGGELFAGAAGQYIEFLGDMDIADNGHDIAAAGTVMNFTRTVSTEGLGANWVGDIRQSLGSQPIDALYRASGAAIVGFDLSAVTMGYYRLASVTLNSGGSGYVLGDLLTVSGGTSTTPTVLQVTGVSSGAITSIGIVNTGIYTAAPVANYNPLTITGGSGTGASISGFYDANTAIILPNGGCIKPAGGTASGETALAAGYYGALCLSTAGLSWGASNTLPAGAGSSNVALGPSNLLQGRQNLVFGSFAYDEASIGARFFANGGINGATGSAQTSDRILKGRGTGTIDLTSDQNAATIQNTYFASTSSAHGLTIRVTAVDRTNYANAARWKNFEAFLTRQTGNASYTGADTSATTPDFSIGTGSTATITMSADTSLQRLKILWTPPASNTDTWDVEAVVVGDQIE